MRFSTKATTHVAALRAHYRSKGRLDAVENLSTALAQAALRIERDPTAGLPAPRSYPGLAIPGQAWIKSGRYWIVYSLTDPPVILGVFYEAADIPNRL